MFIGLNYGDFYDDFQGWNEIKEELEEDLEDYKFPTPLGKIELLNIKVYDEDGTLIEVLSPEDYFGLIEVALNGPNGLNGPIPYWITYTFRALQPGTVEPFFVCFYEENGFIPLVDDEPESEDLCYKVIPVTITQRSLPMSQFMKILGFGGLMRE